MRISLIKSKIAGGTIGRVLLPIALGVVAAVALPGIGGAVGAFFGKYISIAFALGAAVGGVLSSFIFPAKPQPFDPGVPPNPNDFKIPASSEGVPIPFLAGTHKVGTIFLWSKNFRSKAVEQQVVTAGGKGGGGSTVTQVIGYEYFVTFAVALVMGRADKLRSIFANEEEIWGEFKDQTHVSSGDLVVSSEYKNLGPQSILHDGTQYDAGDSFTASATTYTLISDLTNGIVAKHVPSADISIGVDYYVATGVITHDGTQYGDGQASRVFTSSAGYTIDTSPVAVIENVASGALVVGRKYQNLGYTTVTHDGTDYSNGEAFTATVSTYTTSGTGIVAENVTNGLIANGEDYYNSGYPTVQYGGADYSDGEVFTGTTYTYGAHVKHTNTLRRYALPEEQGALVTEEKIVSRDSDKFEDFTIGSNNVRIYWGEQDQLPPNQTEDDFLTDDELPSPNLGYPGICYLVFQDYSLGNFLSVPRITAELTRHQGVYDDLDQMTTDFPGDPPYDFPDADFNSGSGLDKTTKDINPLVALYEMMVNPQYGIKMPPSLIGTGSSDTWVDATQLIEDEGIRLSMYVSQGGGLDRQIELLYQYITGNLYFDGTKIQVILHRGSYFNDVASGSLVAGQFYTVYQYTSVTYNGTVYTTNQSFLAVSGVSTYTTVGSGKVLNLIAVDYTKIVGSLKTSRQTNAQLPTEISFLMTNRDKKYERIGLTKRYNNNFDETGNSIAEGVDLPWICNLDSSAGKIISRIFRQKGMVLAGLEFTGTKDLFPLVAGDVFLLTNIDNPEITSAQSLFVRVAKIREEAFSDQIHLTAVEDPFRGFSDSLSTPVATNADPSVTPGTLKTLVYWEMFELPRALTPTVTDTGPAGLLIASRNQSLQNSFLGHYSVNGTPFAVFGSAGTFALRGILAGGYSHTPFYDDSGLCIIDFSNNTLSSDLDRLDDYSSTELPNGLANQALLFIDDELFRVITATQISGGLYQFTVVRAIYDTELVAHDAGAAAYFVVVGDDGVILQNSLLIDYESTVDYKAQVQDADGNVEDLSAVTSKSLTLTGKYIRPFTPVGFQANLSYHVGAYGAADDVDFQWVPRDRDSGWGTSTSLSTELNGLSLDANDNPVFSNLSVFFTYDDSDFEIDILARGSSTVTRTITKNASDNGSVINSVDSNGYVSATYDNQDINDDGFLASQFVARLYAVGKGTNNAGLRSLRYQEILCFRT